LFKIEKLKLPSQEEIKNNSRARSAKLRIGEKK
jgi:16S rRNA C1402 N4-methylase RsmH